MKLVEDLHLASGCPVVIVCLAPITSRPGVPCLGGGGWNRTSDPSAEMPMLYH
jgi:hypothetical protein